MCVHNFVRTDQWIMSGHVDDDGGQKKKKTKHEKENSVNGAFFLSGPPAVQSQLIAACSPLKFHTEEKKK